MPPKAKARRPTASRRRPSIPPSATPDFEGIRELAASLNALHWQVVADCAPVVQFLIQSQSRDPQYIEQMLDRLLNSACIPEGLALFRALCRYYYFLNPTATADYIAAYRDLWDSDDDKKGEA